MHRTRAPAETVARARPLMPAMGITRLATVTGLDRIGVPVVMVSRPNARSIAVTHGKGLTLDAARASGLMEAAETWHAERIDLPLKFGSQRDLEAAGHPLVDVDALPRVAGDRFHRDLPMLWIEGRDLFTDEPAWLPYEMVHTNWTLPLPPGHGCFPASTNGLASGNHPLEAVCHALCEAVERDATTLWRRLGPAARARTGLDLGTVDDGACREVLARIERAGLAVAAWETTTDVAVPSFYCLIVDHRGDVAHPGEGAGCHPAKEVALLRALTEAAQVRMTYITGARDDLHPDEYAQPALFEKVSKARALMRAIGPPRDFGAIPSRHAATFRDDLAWMLDRLRATGIRQAVAVDLTKPVLGLPVVRVVVPGLEGSDHGDGHVPGPRARRAADAACGRRA
jgi:ribosomal protein S12 methylthiotransferase accessory factor